MNNLDFKYINSIKTNYITSLSIFPLGNIISVSNDKSIKIYDINFKIIQNIQAAHNLRISSVNIKDENNFVTSSDDGSIKTWIKKTIKKENKFYLNKIINYAHSICIYKVLFYLNENLISCSADGILKIWEENDKTYECITIFKNIDAIYSILLIENKNILISSGGNGTRIWNVNNFELIKYINNAECYNNNALNKIDDDKIIIGGGYNNIIKVISIFEKKIIKEINNGFICYGILIDEIMKLILIGGNCNKIKIYKSDNYECVKIINIYDNWINGIIKLENGLIVTYGGDKKMTFWSF